MKNLPPEFLKHPIVLHKCLIKLNFTPHQMEGKQDGIYTKTRKKKPIKHKSWRGIF